MPTDLERRLAATLQVQAGDHVDPAPLVEGSRRRGRRIRHGRVALAALGAVAAFVII